MGYELHITRREFWASDDGPNISQDEWLSYLASDPQFKPDPEKPMPDYAVYFGTTLEWPFWWSSPGNIDAQKYPPHEVRVKMVEIARILNARVQGDEGEIYGPDGAKDKSS